MKRMCNKTSILINIALTIFSSLFCYIVLEFLFSSVFLPYIPFKKQIFVEEGIHILSQSSKDGVIPKNYILILGDSYAQDMRVWFSSTDKSKKSNFQSARFIHDQLERDVVITASSGGGSLRSHVAEPLSQFKYINKTNIFQIEPPEDIVVYFYEGNDLNNNLRDLRLREGLSLDKEITESQILKYVLEVDPIFKKAEAFSIKDNLFFYKFVKNMLFYKNQYQEPSTHLWAKSTINKAMIDGKEVMIGESLQSPALELTDAEIKIAINVFNQSLSLVSKHLPSSQIYVVYIPSPMALYELVSEKVRIETYEGRDSVYDSAFVLERSNKIAEMVKEVATFYGFDFTDAGHKLREAAAKQPIHGPIDWNHFNREGYKAFSEIIIELMKK